MNTTAEKLGIDSKISKSKVMKRAWAKFKHEAFPEIWTFSKCLVWAWKQEKRGIEIEIEKEMRRINNLRRCYDVEQNINVVMRKAAQNSDISWWNKSGS